MIEVDNDFKLKSKKVRQQDIKVTVGNERYKIKQLIYSFDGLLFKTIMKQVEITSKTANQLKDKDINFKYGLYINDAFQYVDLGNFYIKDMEDNRKEEEITVTGYDRMIRFMKTFKQSELQLTYPCTITKLVQKMCEVCETELYSTDFFNSDLVVNEDFFTAQELTYRDVLEKVAQTTLTTAFIKENKLYFCKLSNVVTQQLDQSYISRLVIKEKFGPLNALVLGRGSVEDNVEATDEESITQNGRCEIRFDENEFVQEQRENVIDNMFEQIKGLEYYSYEASDLGVMWLEPCDCIELGDRDGNFYKTYYLKANITLTTGISSDSEAEMPDEADTKYKVTSKAEKKTLKVERLAKKNEGLIKDLAQETTENTEKLTQHEQTIDSISDKVQSNITNINNNYQDVLGKLGDCAQKSDVETISKSVETIQTDSKYAIEIAQEIQQNGVTKVKTSMGYTFDDNGLNIEKTGAETKTVLNEKGLDVKDNTGSSSESLLFAGFDKSTGETVVKSKNMTVEKYLVIGKYSRIEDFTEDGEKGTGFFWIGG